MVLAEVAEGVADWHVCYADVDFGVDLVVGGEIEKDNLESSRVEDLHISTDRGRAGVWEWGWGGDEYLEDFDGTLDEKFGDCGACASQMSVIDFERFEISFTEIVDSGAIHGFSDFIRIFQEKSAEFPCNGTTNRRM